MISRGRIGEKKFVRRKYSIRCLPLMSLYKPTTFPRRIYFPTQKLLSANESAVPLITVSFLIRMPHATWDCPQSHGHRSHHRRKVFLPDGSWDSSLTSLSTQLTVIRENRFNEPRDLHHESGVYVLLCYELADSLNSFGRIKVFPYLCFANSKYEYDETGKKDVAAIGPADSCRSNGTG